MPKFPFSFKNLISACIVRTVIGGFRSTFIASSLPMIACAVPNEPGLSRRAGRSSLKKIATKTPTEGQVFLALSYSAARGSMLTQLRGCGRAAPACPFCRLVQNLAKLSKELWWNAVRVQQLCEYLDERSWLLHVN